MKDNYYTDGDIELTAKETALVKQFEKLAEKWKKDGKDLTLFAGPGRLLVMLRGGTERNPNPTENRDGSQNVDNIVKQIRIEIESGEF